MSSLLPDSTLVAIRAGVGTNSEATWTDETVGKLLDHIDTMETQQRVSNEERRHRLYELGNARALARGLEAQRNAAWDALTEIKQALASNDQILSRIAVICDAILKGIGK